MNDINTFLPFWEGFSIVTIKPDGDALQIALTPHPTQWPACGTCLKPCTTIHEYCERSIRDLPILGHSVQLKVLLRRVNCRTCGKKMEALSWLDQNLLAANQTLMTVYLMKAELKTLWTAAMAWGWRMAWKQWLRHAHESEIPAPIQFAKRLKRYWRGIVSRVRWPMHTGQLEGINNRIKVIKRMAYGYRDSEFFFMKIKSLFPGNP